MNNLYKLRVLLIFIIGLASFPSFGQTFKLSSANYASADILNYTTGTNGANSKRYTTSMNVSGQITFDRVLTANMNQAPVTAVAWNIFDGLNSYTEQNSYTQGQTTVTTNSNGDLVSVGIIMRQWQNLSKKAVNDYTNELWILPGYTAAFNALICVQSSIVDQCTLANQVIEHTSRVLPLPAVTFLSGNANLSGLLISSNGQSSSPPNFSPSTTNYGVSVPYAMATMTLTPTLESGSATILVNGKTVANNTTSSSIVLNQGANTVTIVVTAQDGTKKTYTLTVSRLAPSTNANLSDITLNNNATVSPTLSAATLAYTASVPYLTTTIQLTPTSAETTASISVNGKTTASGVASSDVILNVGSNVINAMATAEDGVTKKTYSVTVTRQAPSTNADLSNLTLSNNASLNTGFVANTTSYTSIVSYSRSTLNVTPTLADATATITVNGKTVSNGSASQTIYLTVGSNTINVTTTAQNGTTKKSYTLVVTRTTPATDANLSGLSLNNGVLLSPSFATNTTSYTSTVLYAVSAIKATPILSDANGSVFVNGKLVANATPSSDILLNVGANTINVVATAEDLITRRGYSAVITRLPASTNADLSSISVNNGVTISPTFATNTYSYTSTVAYAVKTLKFTSSSADATAIISVNGKVVPTGVASSDVLLSVGANTINVVSTAQDGVTKKTYTFVVTRNPASTDADLTSISLNNGASLSPSFATNTSAYTSTVLFAVSAVKLTSFVSDPTAIITVNGKTVANGAASSDVLLSVGANTINVINTAEDGLTKKTYTVVITRSPASTNADLTNLSMNNGASLSPTFSTNTLAYTSTVAYAISSLKFTPTLSDATAIITVNGKTVANGTASSDVLLNVGNNTISVVITAQNGTTKKTYTIVVTRTAASTNAAMSGLSIDQGTLSPSFGANTLAYTTTVANAVNSITLTPTISSTLATLKINGISATGGQANTITLGFGSTTITMVVTAEDKSTVKTYVLTVNRALSSNADLSNLSMTGGALSPTFSSATVTYTATVPYATTSTTITPVKSQANATVKVNTTAVTASKLINLNVGSNTITTDVTAQDGTTTKTYTLTVTRAGASTNANLSTVALSSGTVSITSATSYTGITSTKPTITVTPTAADASSIIKVNGKVVANGATSGLVPLTNGVEVPIQITLTAQDGTTSKTYSLGVTFVAPSCAITPTTLTDNISGKTYKLLTFSSVGDCSWTPPAGVTKIEYLVVGGGGGTAGSTNSGNFVGDFIGGGGGGAGGVLSGTYTITAGQTYNIKVGSGGVGGLKSSNATTRKGNPGVYSQFGNIVANGGGAGGGLDEIGGTGASGGGAGGSADIILNPGGARILGQGNTGGYSSVAVDFAFPYKAAGGGGGGAGGAGANAADQKNAGNGGIGIQSSITGTSVYYGGGGGGGARDKQGFLWADLSVGLGSGGSGGGANGVRNGNGNDGTDGLGGGAGGVGGDGNGGTGGDGIVIIRYEVLPNLPTESTIVGTITTTNNVKTFTSDPSGAVYKVLTFSTLGTYPDWTPPAGITSVDYLVVGGGGSGGTPSLDQYYWTYGFLGCCGVLNGDDTKLGTGGGGAGGLLEGSLTITPGGTYSITVGAGGVAPNYSTSYSSQGSDGDLSKFGNIISAGGGGGGGGLSVLNGAGRPGGSGGGGSGAYDKLGGAGNSPSTVPPQGNSGGNSRSGNATYRSAGGGGGGASSSGLTPVAGTSNAGAGGAGRTSYITGSPIVYSGGGGGGALDGYGSESAGAAGSGGGGAGAVSGTPGNGTNGLGGGGGGRGANGQGGNGGSGIVILRYALSTDANLSGLVLSSGTLSPVFASASTTYTATVANSVSTINITPTLSYAEALVSINGEVAESGQASRAFDLALGSNSFIVSVTAADGKTKKTYTIEVYRISADATLADLSLTEGSLTPTFDAATGTYSALVSSSVTSLKVIPTLTDATATVKVNGVTIVNKQQSGSINLGIGPNIITVLTTAEDGTTTRTYTVTVTRVSVDLSALSIGSGTLSQTFSPSLTTYTSVLANAITSTTILPTAVDANSTVKVNSLVTTSGQSSSPLALKVGDNAIDVDVIAQDGSLQKRYSVTLMRTGPSTMATLSNIALSNGTLSPAFASGTTSYTATVPNSVNSMTLTSTITEANATITVNGDPVISGQSSGRINLGVGANVITVEGTAQDGVTKQTYTITVTRGAPSTVATLANLALSNGTISPVFASGTTTYTTSVPNSVNALTLTPTVTDATATVTVNGDLVASGQSSGQLNLGVGDNVITIVGTAQDGLTQQTYTLTVTRAAPSAVATLANLVLSNGTISPAFSSSTTSYTTTVANAVSSITLTPTVTDATATISVNGDVVVSGQSTASINLGVGANVITVVGLAQDGNTQQVYAVTVTRTAPATDATLSAIVLSNGTLSPAFSSGTTNYSATVATNVSSITLTSTLSNAYATVTVNGDPVISGQSSGVINLGFGTNTLLVVGTAQDGSTQQTYTLTITRTAPSTDASLAGLSLSNGLLSPTFASGTTTYTATVANNVRSITLTPTLTNAAGSITVNGDAILNGQSTSAINLEVGSNVLRIVGTAQDGSTQQIYTVTVTRTGPSTDATLSGLSLSSGLLSPTFASGTASYTATVANNVSSITITPTATNAAAVISVNGDPVISGQSSGAINLGIGTNTITVIGTAQDGSTQQSYTLTVVRTAPATDATLAGLVLSAGSLSPVFSNGTTSYTATVGTNVSSLTLTPTLNDANATVTANGDAVASGQSSGAINLGIGSNSISVIGLAQDRVTQQAYTVTVTRTAPSSVATLAGLSISAGTLSPVFSSSRTNYEATVANSVSSITVTPIVTDANAIIYLNGIPVVSGQASGVVNLSPGENLITVLVRAEDQTTSKTYVLTVIRTATQLSISAPALTLSKLYDGNDSANITAGSLIGVQSGDIVTVTATAKYTDSSVGTGKIIMVTYALSGTDASKYSRPNNEVFDAGIILNISPTISGFTAISKIVGDALTAPTSNSTGAFTYASSNAAVATISGATVTIVGAGTATITATQAADANYLGGTITTTITVAKVNPTISGFTSISKTVGDAAFALTAPATNSTGAFTYVSSNSAVVSISGNTVSVVGAGTATITATQAADANYSSGTITTTITVAKATPTISGFTAISKTVGDAAFALTAPTSNSTGAFTYASSNAAVASISGNTVTVVGAGTATITATQASDANYNGGSIVSTITVIAAPVTTTTVLSNPTISGFASISKTVGDAAFTLTAPTSNSTGAFTYSSSNTSVATISGATVTIVGAGTATITANQAADANYSSGTITTTITVAAATNTNTTTPPVDTDGDGVSDAQEAIDGTDPTSAASFKDTDGDGVPDVVEVQQGTNPVIAGDAKDTDGDGVPDYVEVKQGTNPAVAGDAKDTDGDGVPDYVELQQGTSPTNAADAKDSDGDGIPDYIEVKQGTNPAVAGDAKDTDGDGVPDYIEVLQGTNPLVAGDKIIDTDGDGVPDYVEVQQGTSPTTANDAKDSDGDGVPDYIEKQQGTDPNNNLDGKDSDGDGVPDYVEIQQGTNPNLASDFKDSDGDGVADYIEVQQGTSPTSALSYLDTDGDGISDVIEGFVRMNSTLSTDDDGDGTPDYEDLDSDNDGILDRIEKGSSIIPIDTDGDKIADFRDTDSDNDGILDSFEKGPTATPVDSDKDGKADYIDTDSDGDRIPDSVERGSGSTPVDTDKDGIRDYLDLDSDNDTYVDKDEAGVDPTRPVDTDGDGLADFRDVDSDNDGLADVLEDNLNFGALPDCDGDGIPNRMDKDVCVTFTPQGISPNGDGENDVLLVPGVMSTQPNKLTVYNRTGIVVYEQSNYQNDWGGKDQSGNLLPDGVYYYVVDFFGVKPTVNTFIYISRLAQ
jgi:gliding motility-associated-like protein